MGAVEMYCVPHALMVARTGAISQALGGALLGRICDELQEAYRTASDLTLFLVLGMVTLACQDGCFLRLRDGRLVPLTGYYVAAAPPVSGKSVLLTRLREAFSKAEAEAAAETEQHRRHYDADRHVWKARVRRLTREIDDAIAAGKDVSNLSLKLSVLLVDEPRPPRKASWLAEDTTIQALRRRLHKGWPSAGIVLDEGIRFFHSTLSRAFADFCTLHDGRLARNERITTGTDSVGHAFMSIVIATQPAPLYKYLNEHGGDAFDTGFLARMQLLDARETAPARVLIQRTGRYEALEEYDDRVLALLRDARIRMGKGGDFEPVILELSERAGEMLRQVPLLAGARLPRQESAPQMDPYLGRLPVLIARVAGVLHRFEGLEGVIDERTMSAAIEIGLWLAEETNKVLMRSLEPSPADKADIDILVHLLNIHALHRRRQFITRTELRDMAPTFGLDEARCKRALDGLCRARWVWIESRGNASFVRMSPAFFPVN
ncbi:TPA: DUF3987 domain-containing protein [Burkholderia vietnamiensis]|nr:DUF3987 domain-containing protein [Burkholderia vietnamiensis]